MEIAGLLLKKIIVMYLLMGIGYVLYKKNWLTKNGAKELGNLLLQIILPFTIVNAYLSEYSTEKVKYLFYSFMLALCTLLFSMAVSYLFFKRKYPIENFSSAFSNAGFIGIPLVQSIFGTEAVFYISSYVALLNVFQWTYGVYMMTEKKDTIKLKNLCKNPILIGMVLGILFFVFRISLPEVCLEVLSSVSGMNAPIAMIILGTYLAQLSLKEVFAGRLTYLASGIRLVLIPLGTWLILSLFSGVSYEIRMVVMIAASTPVGSNVAIFAQKYQLSYTQAVKEVCLSTLISLVTLPLMVMLASCFWV